ncbi:MAG: VapC toxin family PIN domain ribonuclease [Thiotrichaceae bacterium IS1]|nr:MAG: VapC toxin family PIN domain ribonuclease [Thiotrichaceae bacterium IS1]
MVIDPSAIIAILLGEPEAAALVKAMGQDGKRLVSVFSVLEASVVLERRKGETGQRDLDRFLRDAKITMVDFNEPQLEIAREAWRKFGKDRHPARLNLGDCCSYALAKYTGEPLLFKGKDFSQTDLTRLCYKEE